MLVQRFYPAGGLSDERKTRISTGVSTAVRRFPQVFTTHWPVVAGVGAVPIDVIAANVWLLSDRRSTDAGQFYMDLDCAEPAICWRNDRACLNC